MRKYDYIVVGTRLFDATFANLTKKDGKKVLVLGKIDYIVGNVYTKYGENKS